MFGIIWFKFKTCVCVCVCKSASTLQQTHQVVHIYIFKKNPKPSYRGTLHFFQGLQTRKQKNGIL